MRKKYIILVILLLLSFKSFSQVFNEGRESSRVKYFQIKTENYKLIYPKDFTSEAYRVSYFLDTITPYVRYGMKGIQSPFPVVLYTSDQLSNGMVSLVPNRDIMMLQPPVSMTATPWMKQLSIHEYRHVAQMSALNNGVFKYARYVFGEISSAIALAMVPKWILEGDATNAETQLSSFGRGMQPSFSIEYRALMSEEAKKPFNKLSIDNLIQGSFKYNIPDIYHFGYYMVRSYENKSSLTFTGDFFDLLTRRPYLITPIFVYTSSHGFKSVKRMARQTFNELDSLWRPTYQCENNYDFMTESERSYTEYLYPIPLPGESFLALKKTMDSPECFVIHNGNKETVLMQPGTISSRPVVRGNILYWTEYKNNVFYERQNTSIIHCLRLNDKIRESYQKGKSNYLLTPIPDGWAMVRYDSLLHAKIVIADFGFVDTDTVSFDQNVSIHGLAYDYNTSFLCYIAVSDDGMYIGAVDKNKNITILREPSSVTLSDLSADNGKLFYSSIQSGKDEIHQFDILSGEEYQLTASKFGAKQPVARKDTVMFVGYSASGWHVSKTAVKEDSSKFVKWQRMPEDILNPKWASWDLAKSFDSIKITSLPRKTKRYHRASNWFNFHSWAPGISANVTSLMEDFSANLGFGATGLFQSVTGDFMGSVALGSRYGLFWSQGQISYSGLPVIFTLRGEYGGGHSISYVPNEDGYLVETIKNEGTYARADVVASLPMNFSSYAVSRILTPTISYSNSADRIYDNDSEASVTGLNRYQFDLSYSAIRSASYRAISPRFGAVINMGVMGAFHSKFAKLYYAKMKFYFPGLLKNHSIILNYTAQYQHLSTYNFISKTVIPTGIIDHNIYQKYYFSSASYKFPIFYPEGGIDRYIFFKRLYAGIFAEYSLGKLSSTHNMPGIEHYSYGIDVGLDLSVLTSFNQNVQFRIAFPQSSNVFVGFSYQFSFR